MLCRQHIFMYNCKKEYDLMANIYAVISGDLISSRRIKPEQKISLYRDLAYLLSRKDDLLIMQGEITRGDSFQCLIEEPKNALRCILILKMFLAQWPSDATAPEPVKARIALGIGEVEFIEKNLAISDGEAFQQAGKLLDELKRNKHARLAVFINQPAIQSSLSTVFALLDATTYKTTPIQAKAVYQKLMGKNQMEIAAAMKTTQPLVSRHLAAAHWAAIDVALKYFEKTLSNINS
jgi:hypothetical protein